MDNLLADLKQAFRVVSRNWKFSVLMILILGIGIAATTSMVTVLDSVLYRTFPFKDADRLVVVWVKSLKVAWMDEDMISPAILADWRSGNHSFQDLASFTWLQSYTISGDAAPQRIRGSRVSENLFTTLGTQLPLGRVFTDDDLRKEDGHVALIGYGLWQSRFGGSRDILTRKIRLNGETYSIVGILPADFQLVFLSAPDVLIPLKLTPSEALERNNRLVCVVGRLRPGISVQEASKDMNALAARLGAQYPPEAEWGVNPVPLREEGTLDVRNKFSIFLGIAVLTLIIACSNMANLLLARILRRSGELAMRLALGISRFRLLRQLLLENLILVSSAGLLSLGAAYFIANQFLHHSPVYFPPGIYIKIDWRIFAICMAASLLMGVLVTLAPALSAMRLNIGRALSLSSARIAGRFGIVGYLQRNLVMLEVGVSFILLVVAGLMVQTMVRIDHVNLGFDAANLMSFKISLGKARYSEPVTQLNFYHTLLERIRTTPGVESSSAISFLPLSMSGTNNSIRTRNMSPETTEQKPNASTRVVMPNYFSVMKIRLLRGRLFSETGERIPVPVISQTLAERYFPGEDPVGQELYVLQPLQADADRVAPGPREIIGVVEDVRESGPQKEPWPEAYFSFDQVPVPSLAVVLRTRNATSVMSTIRRHAMEMDPDQPIYSVQSMDDALAELSRPMKFQVASIAIFAAIALVLAIAGLYSVISYSVMQRKQEIGIRIALGAQPAKVIRMILSQGITVGAIGLALGIAGALLLTRYIYSLLYHTRANDPLTFAVVVVLLSTVVTAASYYPARRAAKVEPSTVLRSE
jgi:putative ABC transport system permease protein